MNSADVLVVDSHSKPSAAAGLIAQIKKQVTTKPVRYLVDTHFHWDHAQGNAGYRDAFGKDLKIISSAKTKQLEALKSYTMGVKVSHEQGDARSIPFLKRAIELDPNFATAYAALAVNYGNLQEPSTALQYAKKAYELRDRVSEREKAPNARSSRK